MIDRPYRNFIIFWFSQSVSQLGSSMTSFALIIWSYGRTGSAMSVAAFAVSGAAVMFLCTGIFGSLSCFLCYKKMKQNG